MRALQSVLGRQDDNGTFKIITQWDPMTPGLMGGLTQLKLPGYLTVTFRQSGQNFLFAAAVAGREAVIRFVLEHLEHHDLLSVDGRGWSLLHAAAHHGHREAAQLLVDASCHTAATDMVSRGKEGVWSCERALTYDYTDMIVLKHA